MKRLIKATAMMGTAIFASMFINLVRVKLTTILIGTIGIGITGTFNGLFGLISQVTGLGTYSGIMKYSAEDNAAGRIDRIERLKVTLFVVLFVCGLAGGVLGIVFAKKISVFVFGHARYTGYTRIVCAALPLNGITFLLTGLLNGFRDIRALSVFRILGSLGTLVILIPLIYFFGVVAALYYFVVFTIIRGLVGIYYFRQLPLKSNARNFVNLRIFDWQILGKVLMFGMAVLVVQAGVELSIVLVRKLVIYKLGEVSNGIFQPVLALGSQYVMIAVVSIAAYGVPTLSGIKDSRQITLELNSMIRLALLPAVPVLVGLSVFRTSVIRILYTADQLPAADLLPLQVFFVFFLVLGRMLEMPMIAMARLRFYALTNTIVRAILVGAGYLLVGRYGLSGIVLAFVISGVILTLMAFFYQRAVIGFKLSRANLVLLPTSLVLLIACFFLIKLPGVFRFVLPIGALGLWCFLVVTREEVEKSIALLKDVIRKYRGQETGLGTGI